MKTIRLQLALACLLVASAWGQQAFPGGSPYASHQLLAFPVYSLNAAPVAGASLYPVGVSGQTTYCYWAVANYQIGSVLSSLGCIPNSANTLSGSNYNAVDPWLYPAGLSAGVDILRTITPQAPSGACNCAVATGVTSGIVNDQSNSLSSYTVTLLQPNKLALTLTTEVTGNGAAHLILRQGWPWPGTQIADLSAAAGGGVTGSGTIGHFAGWTGSSALGDIPCTYTLTGSGLIQCIATNVGNSATAQLNLAGVQTSNTVGNAAIRFSAPSTGEVLEVVPSGSTATSHPSGVNVIVPSGSVFSVNPGVTSAFYVTDQGFGYFLKQMQAAFIRTVPTTFSAAGTCSGTSNEGLQFAITDSTTNTWGATVTGGGSNHVLIYCDGTNWTVSAK